MKLQFHELQNQIEQALAPIYLISGDEPWQKQQALDCLCAQAKAQGYDERVTFQVNAQFDWQQLFDETSSLSLFSARKTIILHCASGKIGIKGSKALQDYLANCPPDILLIIMSSKLEPALTKSKWVKAIEQQGVFLPLWPLSGPALKRWLGQQCQAAGLHCSAEGLDCLCAANEGNMLALAQTVEKLALLYGTGELSYEQICASISDNAKYSVFELTDSALSGQSKRVTHILQILQQEGIQPTLILWALTREIKLMVDFSIAKANGQLPRAFSQARVWQNKQNLYQQALSRLRTRPLQHALVYAAECDKIIKGVNPGNRWQCLQTLSLMLCGIRILAQTSSLT